MVIDAAQKLWCSDALLYQKRSLKRLWITLNLLEEPERRWNMGGMDQLQNAEEIIRFVVREVGQDQMLRVVEVYTVPC